MSFPGSYFSMKLSEKLVHEHAIPGVKKLQNTVKLKGLDEF